MTSAHLRKFIASYLKKNLYQNSMHARLLYNEQVGMIIHQSPKEIYWVTVNTEPYFGRTTALLLYFWKRGKTILQESCFPATKKMFFETRDFAFSMFNYSQLPAAANYQFMFRRNGININSILIASGQYNEKIKVLALAKQRFNPPFSI